MPRKRSNTARSRALMEEDLKQQDRNLIPVKVPAYINRQINEEADRLGTSRADVVSILWEFYNFEYPDLLVKRVKERYLQGLAPKEAAGLSVLYSLLSYINTRTKMLE